MTRVLERLFERPGQPEVLDLTSGSPAVCLADRGARVSVENFTPPSAAPVVARDEEGEPLPPEMAIQQPDGKFDLVLAWEHGDFVPPERLKEFASELRRVLAPGGWVVLYAQDRLNGEDSRADRPARFQLTDNDRLVRTPSPGPAQPRWAYPVRAIEKALSPLAVQGIHLQPNRVREFIARKPT